MSDKELGETQQNTPANSNNIEDTQELQLEKSSDSSATTNEGRPQKGRSSRFRLILGITLGLLVFITLGALGGMQAGIQDREGQERLDRAVEAVAQFELGRNDLANGQCAIARQRFEYVIQLNPLFPEAAEKLAASMLCVGVEDGPVAEATLAPTPTLDGRSAEEIFGQVMAYFEAQNWDALLPSLDTLRSVDPAYEALEVDRMYYLALRNRGVSRILNQGELEGGIFDLNQAEQIGPLDTEAANFRDWSILYIIGQSFWDVDWGQAVQYFSQIAAVAPNLSDSNFYTAADRLVDAQVEYAALLIVDAKFIAGSKQWCTAQQMLSEANSYSPLSPEVQVTATWYADKCALNGNE